MAGRLESVDTPRGGGAREDGSLDPNDLMAQAMRAGRWDMARALALSAGVDPDARCGQGPTLLLMAGWAGQAKLLESLWRLGGDACKRFHGKGLADMAVESRDAATVALSLAMLPEPALDEAKEGHLRKLAQPLGLARQVDELLCAEQLSRRHRALDRALRDAPAPASRQRL